jgi:predicted DNA-binding transcriptional regulator YafY
MNQAENIYGRLDAIERMLASSPNGRSTSELALQFGVDADTIRRDLVRLEDLGTSLTKLGRRYLIDHRRSFHRVRLSNDEALALYLAARLLSRHSDEHNPHVVKALEKLADALSVKSPLIAGHMARAADTVRARRVRREYVEALEVLTQGWAEGRKVCMATAHTTKTKSPSARLRPTSLSLRVSAMPAM